MRITNWPIIAAREIEKYRSSPFVCGESDCCLAVANIVKAYTGVDIAETFRGKYKTELGARRALKRYAGGDIKSAADLILERVPVEQASRGDIGLVTTDSGESLAVLFNQRAWAMSLSGMVDLPISSVICAWRIN